MRLSRDKINKLAYVVTDELVIHDEVEFVEDRNTIRLEIVRILTEEMKKEEGLDQEARRKIESQKRRFPRAVWSGTSYIANIMLKS